jgi:hypothetical protein
MFQGIVYLELGIASRIAARTRPGTARADWDYPPASTDLKLDAVVLRPALPGETGSKEKPRKNITRVISA